MTGPALTAEVPVTSYKGVIVSVTSPLTEATLDGSVATLTLTGGIIYETDISKIRDAVAVTGIDGVMIDPVTVQRLSGTEITVALAFDDTDFDMDTELTFSIDTSAIVGNIGTHTSKILVLAVIESVSAAIVSPLTETNLDEGSVTLTLVGATYEQDISTIREAVNVSGINGVTLDTTTVQRVSGTEITADLTYDGTDFDADTALTFSIASDAVANYIGEEITTEIPVTAIREGISASVVSPLTETNLDEGSVTLTLAGATYEQDISTIREAVNVSGIDGVTIDTDTMQRVSDTKITIELNFDDTDFDSETRLMFSIDTAAIVGDSARAELTTGVPVTAVKEFISVSAASPLTEATLNEGTVTLILTGAAYEADVSKIGSAVTVSGITGVTVDTSTVQRLSDRKITVELNFDGTDFSRDSALTFSVADGAITNYKGTALTAEALVTASRGEALLTIFWTDSHTDKIQRANLDGSNIEDLVTTGLGGPRGIALDVAGGKMYWTDYYTEKIQRANLDGSNIEDLVTTGLRYPGGIALDVEGGKMYWTDYGTDKIQRANLDGSNLEDLITTGLEAPRGIALDVAGGKMYWTDRGTDKIQRANLDGSNIEDLVTTGLRYPGGIALDVEGGKMYWTDSHTEKIQRANLDGSNIEDLVTQGLSGPGDIALDVVASKMYWTDYYTNKIQRAYLDGSNVEDLVTQGLRDPYGIALGILPPANPTIVREDVNRDGVVNVQDLAYVGLQYGKTGTNTADVNGDEVVNVADLILVAAAIDAAAAAAPAVRAQVQSYFTKAQLHGWLTEARASKNTSSTYQRGIVVLEQLLTLFAPEETALLANYPNPFNPETWIPYHLSKAADVKLTIYDINGRVVRDLDLGHQRAGLYQSRNRAAHWDGRNAQGELVASGVYFYTLTAGDFSATRKMLIRK